MMRCKRVSKKYKNKIKKVSEMKEKMGSNDSETSTVALLLMDTIDMK